MTSSPVPATDPPRPLREHLEDLRHCLIGMGLAALLGCLAAIPLAPWMLDMLKRPLARTVPDPDTFVRAIYLASGVRTLMTLVFWGGMVLSLPWMLAILARFVFPGLAPGERRLLRRLTGFAGLLFVLGVALGYGFTLEAVIRFTLLVNRWLNIEMEMVELAEYVSFALKLLLSFGLAFELPVLLLGAGYAGWVTSPALRRARRGVIVGAFALAMVLTPPDPFTQMIMATALIALYELCIVLIRWHEHARTRPGIRTG